MNYTQLFIEKIIEGGWGKSIKGTPKCDGNTCIWYSDYNADDDEYTIEARTSIDTILLDPKAWRAIGKSLKWKECIQNCKEEKTDYCGGFHIPESKQKHHQFLDSLWEGKDINEALSDLIK